MSNEKITLEEALKYLRKDANRTNLIFLLKDLRDNKVKLFAFDENGYEVNGFFRWKDYPSYVDSPDELFPFYEPVKKETKKKANFTNVKLKNCFTTKQDVDFLTKQKIVVEDFVLDEANLSILFKGEEITGLSRDKFAVINYLYKLFLEGDLTYKSNEEIFEGADISRSKHDGYVSKLFSKDPKIKEKLLDNKDKVGWRLSLCSRNS